MLENKKTHNLQHSWKVGGLWDTLRHWLSNYLTARIPELEGKGVDFKWGKEIHPVELVKGEREEVGRALWDAGWEVTGVCLREFSLRTKTPRYSITAEVGGSVRVVFGAPLTDATVEKSVVCGLRCEIDYIKVADIKISLPDVWEGGGEWAVAVVAPRPLREVDLYGFSPSALGVARVLRTLLVEREDDFALFAICKGWIEGQMLALATDAADREEDAGELILGEDYVSVFRLVSSTPVRRCEVEIGKGEETLSFYRLAYKVVHNYVSDGAPCDGGGVFYLHFTLFVQRQEGKRKVIATVELSPEDVSTLHVLPSKCIHKKEMWVQVGETPPPHLLFPTSLFAKDAPESIPHALTTFAYIDYPLWFAEKVGVTVSLTSQEETVFPIVSREKWGAIAVSLAKVFAVAWLPSATFPLRGGETNAPCSLTITNTSLRFSPLKVNVRTTPKVISISILSSFDGNFLLSQVEENEEEASLSFLPQAAGDARGLAEINITLPQDPKKNAKVSWEVTLSLTPSEQEDIFLNLMERKQPKVVISKSVDEITLLPPVGEELAALLREGGSEGGDHPTAHLRLLRTLIWVMMQALTPPYTVQVRGAEESKKSISAAEAFPWGMF